MIGDVVATSRHYEYRIRWHQRRDGSSGWISMEIGCGNSAVAAERLQLHLRKLAELAPDYFQVPAVQRRLPVVAATGWNNVVV
jgi:hypothetical protein